MIYALSIVITTWIGARKGEALGAFIVGLLLGPFGIIIALASSGRKKRAA